MRLHSCWGNRDGPHTEDVALEHVLPHLLEAKVGGSASRSRTPAHSHEVEALGNSAIPCDLALVVVVIESTNNYVEHPEVVKRRIVEAATALGDRERIIAGVDCGFGTFAGDRFVAGRTWCGPSSRPSPRGRSSPPRSCGSRRPPAGWMHDLATTNQYGVT